MENLKAKLPIEAAGDAPVKGFTIGSVNLTEFFVALAALLPHWNIIAGLILGGVIAAPIAASFAKRLPVKTMMIVVGILVVLISLRMYVTLAGHEG